MTNPTAPDLRAHFSALFEAALREVAPNLPEASIVLEKPRQADHGDYACSIALQLARQLRAKPRDIAGRLIAVLPASPYLEKAEVAGAGFINLFLKRSFKQQVVSRVLQGSADYGKCSVGQKKKVQVEFVSANPTGPLHVGHGRGAAFGASLADVLAAAGFAVTREFYINDAGRQMDILALSTWLRYLELAGLDLPFPPNAYQGSYVRDMARQVFAAHGKQYVRDPAQIVAGVPEVATDAEAHLDGLIANAKALLGNDYEYIHRVTLNEQLADCRSDLAEFGVVFDHWFSERSLYDSGMVERAVQSLEARGHVYMQDGAKWFRSTEFGDEKDRVIQRENGQYTYFASDIAYHLNKFERGFDLVVDVWGADHHGYIPRVKGALQALGLNPTQLTIALVQFAVLYRGGQKVSMSTRAGEFVTLRELRREVGNDAARFFYVLRKSDQHLDFDLDLAKSQSHENPVYYIQYAHARICSVHEQWGGAIEDLRGVDLAPLASAQELALLQRLIEYPDAVEDAARELAPHLIAFYLRDLAGEFHSYYNATRVLADEEPVRLARLALVTAVRQVLRNGLALLGVGAPERM
ncbi:MAG: arginine--tRNA ligase [Betaproteobacteria bacterium]|nr:arginine--tRNA ligase [Betaproteobacteria bacterium]